jgi:dihydropyrimidine dehydrogenase (NAD+) subunit PreA
MLRTDFCGIEIPNPFILASAPPTATGDMIKEAFKAGWGGAVTKTLAMDKDRDVNVAPRLQTLSFPGKHGGTGKLYGLENIELASERKLDTWLEEIRSISREYPDRILIASIMASGDDKDSWQILAKSCENAGAKMLELNFSCPHGLPEKGMGCVVGQDAEMCKTITGWVRKSCSVPIMPKLTPNITDITLPAVASIERGADAIAAINTVSVVMGVDLKTLNPLPDVGSFTTSGGYSGPAIKPIGLKAVSSLHNAIDVPISGVGGIENWRDAVEYMLLGAGTVQLCTAVMFHGYSIIHKLTRGLLYFMDEHGFKTIDEFIGTSAQKIIEHSRLDRTVRMVAAVDGGTCIKCKLCYVSCRDAGYQAITVDGDHLPLVNRESCTGCSLCQQVCPVLDCIQLVHVT